MRQILITLLALLFTFQNLYAGTIKIPNDQPTIQVGIVSSSNGDTILVSPGTYFENINFNGKNIVLGSLFLTTGDTSYISQTIIDGSQQGCVVVFESGEDSTAVLTGFTITNGYSYIDSTRGGGITCINSSNPKLTNLVVENNEIVGDDEVYGGGGIYCLRQSSPKIANVVIRENKARNCYGTGIYCKDSSNISLVNVVISDNEYTFRGGGIAIVNSRLTISKSQIVNNIARYGGGIFLENSTIQIDNSMINQNVARSNGRGGGIWALVSNIRIKNSDISYNSAIYKYTSQASYLSEGGGLYLNDCIVIIENSNISYNICENNGGGFSIKNSTVKIYRSSINNNRAVIVGGGGGGMSIILTSGAPIYLEDVVISDNYASGSGGGIAYGANEKTVPFKNVVIKNNSAEKNGGGIVSNENLIIDESSGCSIFLNKAKEEGSDIYVYFLDSISTYEVNLDTVTVSEPEDYNIYPIQNINLQYHQAIFQSVNSDLYVSPTGSDLNSGVSKEYSLKSISFALSVASTKNNTNRTINLAHGVYSPSTNGEKFPLYGRSYVTLSGEDIKTTILDGERKSRIIEFSDIKNAAFENMTIQNGFAFASKNIFEEYIGSGGGIAGRGNEIIFKNFVVRNNRAMKSGGGLYLTGNIELNKVQIYNNVLDTTYRYYGGAGLSLGSLEPFDHAKIVNSTIINNTVYAEPYNSGGLSIVNMDVSIVNSIIWNNSPINISITSQNLGPFANNLSSLNIAYSNIHGSGEGIVITDSAIVNWLDGNIDTDPLFVGGNPFDYNLSNSSPCINAGTPFLVWEGDTLINLSPSEYIGEAPDMGALESDVLISVEGEETVPTEFKLEQNYPNPFNPSTIIKYSIPSVKTPLLGGVGGGLVTLKVYDILGREVTTLVNKEQKPGNYEITFDAGSAAGGLSSGLYFYRLKSGNFIETKKMILLK